MELYIYLIFIGWKNGAYIWHLQRLLSMTQNSFETKRSFSQTFQDKSDRTDLLDYISRHPEHGIIIDTTSDPIQSLFPPLPQTSLSLGETCQNYPWVKNWYPCTTRPEMISSSTVKQSLFTYVLYDVTIDMCDQCKRSTTVSKVIHYDEIIYLFDSQQQITNETHFVKQILPRFIRLLALAPRSAYVFLPYLNTKAYVNQYIDVLIERGIITDKKRFIEYNSSQIYHANALYSTSTPRSDVILLNKILIDSKPLARRELILIIQNDLDDYSYSEIIQTIHQFELPEDFAYLHIQEYKEGSYNLTQIRDLFRQARIVIGMPTDVLSHIVWCQPRTHIIEIIQKTMTTDYYEISLQLRLHYWLVMTTKANIIDIIDFRNLMMKVLADIDA